MAEGFSLTEVLVSLLLLTTTSLAVFKQQLQVTQLFNQISIRSNTFSEFENKAERSLLAVN